MCINNNDSELKKVRSKSSELKLWKVIRRDNQIGLWSGTGWRSIIEVPETYNIGVNVANAFTFHERFNLSISSSPGQFHCFFTRREARKYTKIRYSKCSMFSEVKSKRTKIVHVYAGSSDVVRIGEDETSGIRAISVSKMEIKSLKHQR